MKKSIFTLLTAASLLMLSGCSNIFSFNDVKIKDKDYQDELAQNVSSGNTSADSFVINSVTADVTDSTYDSTSSDLSVIKIEANLDIDKSSLDNVKFFAIDYELIEDPSSTEVYKRAGSITPVKKSVIDNVAYFALNLKDVNGVEINVLPGLKSVSGQKLDTDGDSVQGEEDDADVYYLTSSSYAGLKYGLPKLKPSAAKLNVSLSYVTTDAATSKINFYFDVDAPSNVESLKAIFNGHIVVQKYVPGATWKDLTTELTDNGATGLIVSAESNEAPVLYRVICKNADTVVTPKKFMGCNFKLTYDANEKTVILVEKYALANAPDAKIIPWEVLFDYQEEVKSDNSVMGYKLKKVSSSTTEAYLPGGCSLGDYVGTDKFTFYDRNGNKLNVEYSVDYTDADYMALYFTEAQNKIRYIYVDKTFGIEIIKDGQSYVYQLGNSADTIFTPLDGATLVKSFTSPIDALHDQIDEYADGKNVYIASNSTFYLTFTIPAGYGVKITSYDGWTNANLYSSSNKLDCSYDLGSGSETTNIWNNADYPLNGSGGTYTLNPDTDTDYTLKVYAYGHGSESGEFYLKMEVIE